MGELKPNSHKFRDQQNESDEPKVEKVVSGVGKLRKKSEIRKFADNFISEDAGNVKTYIFLDVLIPAIKKAISDVVTNGIDMILYGETGRSKKGASKVSYRSYYDRGSEREPSFSRKGYNYEDVVVETRGEAESVLAELEECIAVYGWVSVADLYSAVGITGEYTDNKYGWSDLRNASIVRVRNGHMLKLPRALPFK